MATSQTPEAGLTKLDLRALKEADQVVFRHHQRTERGVSLLGQDKGPKGLIELTRKLARPTPWEDEARYDIQVESRIRKFDEPDEYTYAFYMLHSTHYNDEWRTVLAFLRGGDELWLEWLANSNGYCRQVGHHLDQLRLKVRRGKLAYGFHIGDSVCPDNSARMIRRLP